MATYSSGNSPAASSNELDARLARALEIASHREDILRLGENEWSVPSQTTFGRYKVWFVGDQPRCTCDDWNTRVSQREPMPCKHGLAVVQLKLQDHGQSLSPPEHKPRKQYPQHRNYTKGQTAEMRLVEAMARGLTADLADMPKQPGKGGRPSIPISDAIYCAILKTYSGLSGRRACGVYENVADRKLLGRVPSFMVASRALNRPETTAILYGILRQSAIPLAGLEDGGAVAPDSTGVQTTSFGGWREEKHGERRQKRWLKVHAVVGTKTHIVIDARVLESNSADAPQFATLLNGVRVAGFHPSFVLGDKGYLSHANYQAAAEMGLEARIPFKSNSIGGGSGWTGAWRKAYHMFQAEREQFDREYHKRSNVESVFSAIKRKFGENVRSRTAVAQVNEVLCKLICYNLTVIVHEMYEHGIAPAFLKQNPAS